MSKAYFLFLIQIFVHVDLVFFIIIPLITAEPTKLGPEQNQVFHY
jgi:hypothetical protein